jgi:peptide methionine sulfoxide reductase msrA/msrB
LFRNGSKKGNSLPVRQRFTLCDALLYLEKAGMNLKRVLLTLWAGTLVIAACHAQSGDDQMKYNTLTAEEEQVILHKGTERPFTGQYTDLQEKGTYLCKRCNAPLYRSEDKFHSDCGWPSFDDEIAGAVKRIPDADGQRTEIVCANCGGHLGHVFLGEGFTARNTRHCVNSISMSFIPTGQSLPAPLGAAAHRTEAGKYAKAWFAGGCFWGVEHYFEKAEGVIEAKSGYMGGHVDHPTYKQVCTGTTGHAETVEVTYDPAQTSYETLARLFFEIHDPTQSDGQGPDIGDQYRSVVFYSTTQEKAAAEKLITLLRDKGYQVVTEVVPAAAFWEAEGYHQDYYVHTGKQPYCHFYTKRF